MLDCHRREEIRFNTTNLRSIVTEGKKYDLLPQICARVSQKGRSTIVVTNMCSIVLDCHRREEVRFIVANLCPIVTAGKKYDLLPPICARLSQKGRSTTCCHQFILDCCRRRSMICCHQFVLDCYRREEVRLVATNLCSIVTEGKKYDLLSPICAGLSQQGRSTICCHQFVFDCFRRKKYDLLPPIFARLSQKGRSMICNLCSIVTEGKHNLLPPICARLSQKGRSTICCRQFVLECYRREEIRFVATNFVLGCHKREEV